MLVTEVAIYDVSNIEFVLTGRGFKPIDAQIIVKIDA